MNVYTEDCPLCERPMNCSITFCMAPSSSGGGSSSWTTWTSSVMIVSSLPSRRTLWVRISFFRTILHIPTNSTLTADTLHERTHEHWNGDVQQMQLRPSSQWCQYLGWTHEYALVAATLRISDYIFNKTCQWSDELTVACVRVQLYKSSLVSMFDNVTVCWGFFS